MCNYFLKSKNKQPIPSIPIVDETIQPKKKQKVQETSGSGEGSSEKD